MLRVALVSLVALSGCKTVVEDNGPDEWEREKAWQACTAEPMLFSDRVSADIRIRCAEAIYGRY